MERYDVLPVTALSPPQFRTPWIEPQALQDRARLYDAHSHILITALPGSGKTRLMAQLAADMQTAFDSVAWLRIDAGTDGALATNIAVALIPVLGERSVTAAILMTPGALPWPLALTICLNEVASSSTQFALFLDDIGNVRSDDGLGVLQTLLDQAPANLRIVMASRRTMPLKLARLVADGRLLRIDNQSLNLGSDQIADLVGTLGQPRPELAELRLLLDETAGWVGGVRLLTRKDFGRKDKMSALTLNPALLAYFREEVLDALSPDTRRLLGVILLPHSLAEDLIVHLARPAAVKAALVELQAFCLLEAIPEGKGTRYSAAPLLAAVAARLHPIDAEEEQRLHRCCSAWFEAHGEPQAAAAHAIDAGDTERAIELIDRCGMTMIANGQVTALQQWMARLPLDRLRLRPWALLAVAWAVSLLYRLDEAMPLIEAIEMDLTANGSGEEALAASVAAMRVMHHSMRDRLPQAEAASRDWIARFGRKDDWPTYVVNNSLSFALAHGGRVNEARLVLERAYLPNYHAQGPYATIYSRCILGLIDLRDGQVRRAEANFAWALKAAENDAGSNSTGAVMAAGLLASARRERNDRAGAERLLDGYAWWMHGHLFTDARFHAYRARARDQMRRRQYRAAVSTLEQVLDSGPSVRLQRLQADVLVEKIEVAIAQHDLRMCHTYIRALSDLYQGVEDDPFLSRYLEAGLIGSQAYLDMTLGAWDEAVAFLRRAIRLDFLGGWKLRAFNWAVLLACAYWKSGRREKAIRLMDRLVGYAARAGIASAILDRGKDILPLLKEVAKHADGANPRKKRYVRRLREALDPNLVALAHEDPPETPEARDMLTARELDLIRLVKGGLTNREIAARMHVSENTIKWHLKNVFEKVSVKKRAELAGLALPGPTRKATRPMGGFARSPAR